MGLYLGVDIGTSAIKATVIDEDGFIRKHLRVPSRVISPLPGFFEVEPDSIWWEGFLRVCGLIKESLNPADIRSVCISSVCGSFVPVDREFNPVYNAVLYGIDTRAADQVERLNRRYGKKDLTSLLGGVFTTHSAIPKFLWLREHRPDIYGKTRYFLESGNFITARLTGRTAWDYPTASGTFLLDLNILELPRRIFQDLRLDEDKIPECKWPLEVLGEVTGKASSLTGLRKGTPVLTGACDINAEAVACGAVFPGDMVVVYGSTVSVLLTVDVLTRLDGFVSGVSLMQDSYRLGGATSSGGRLLNWVDSLFAGEAGSVEEEEIRSGLPTGLLMLPYLDGARLPFHNPEARAVWFGISSRTTARELRKSAREALGFELAVIIERLGTAAAVPESFHAMGGLANDYELMRIISDITGKTQKTFTAADASYGDALMAMTVDRDLAEIAGLDGVRRMRGEGRVIAPDRTKHREYLPLVTKFSLLYESVEGLFL